MDKNEVYAFLKESNISYEVDEHKAVYNMAELADVKLTYPERDGKNLFVRDDKKRNYYLITVYGDKRVDLKQFRNNFGTRALSFASDNDLMKYLNLEPGSVTPLGLLNDSETKVIFYLDNDFFKGNKKIGIHPNDNTATLWLDVNDLVKIIKDHGNEVHMIDL